MILDQLHKVNDIKKLDESQLEQLRGEIRSFLIESIAISVTGGILGIVVGWLGTLVCSSFGLPVSIPMWSIFLSFAVCTVIGILFGFFPARKAAAMDPIEALRYE